MNAVEGFGLLKSNRLDKKLELLYGNNPKTIESQKARYIKAVERFFEMFGDRDDLHLLSVPGRSEVGGNHTDHNHGRVLACAVDLDIIAVVSKSDSGVARVKSEGFEMDEVDLAGLKPVESEKYHSQALIRGTAARLAELGFAVGGFDAYTTSSVLKGSGLSSSAAFEVMIANIMSALYNGGSIDPVTMAKAAQVAERDYFGKPCGLMDQTACAVGSFITIDFADTAAPVIEKLDFDFAKTGHTLCIVDTRGNHSDLNEDYAAIQREMQEAARSMGKETLRECDEQEFLARLPELREKISGRAVMRALHFFGDNARVLEQTKALKSGDFARFKELVVDSGRSSFMYLQNCFSTEKPNEQNLPLALALSEKILVGRGAWRVHGGGFAGTMQAFVPDDKLEEYVGTMNRVFGVGASYCLSVRPVGAYTLL